MEWRPILQSATVAALLVVAGLGITLAPSTSGQAQPPAKPSEVQALQAAEREIQAQIDRLVEQLRQLEAARRAHLERAIDVEVRKTFDARKASGPMGGGVGGPMGSPMGGRAPGSPMGSPMGGRAPGSNFAAEGGAPGPHPGEALIRRLDGLEKKLDAVLWEVTHLRHDMSKSRTAPSGPRGSAPAGAWSTEPVPPRAATTPAAPPGEARNPFVQPPPAIRGN